MSGQEIGSRRLFVRLNVTATVGLGGRFSSRRLAVLYTPRKCWNTWGQHDDHLSLAEVRETIPRLASFWAMNETSRTGRLELDPAQVDRNGDPVTRVTFPLTDWDAVWGTRFKEFIPRFKDALGAARVSDFSTMWPSGIHSTGTTSMAETADEGVCDTNQKVFGLDNLYLASGSVFPHSGAAAPTLTIAALALRLADHLEPTTKKAR